jgi:hypothetical protein
VVLEVMHHRGQIGEDRHRRELERGQEVGRIGISWVVPAAIRVVALRKVGPHDQKPPPPDGPDGTVLLDRASIDVPMGQ